MMEYGFYWVFWESGEPEIARLDKDGWWFTDDDRPHVDDKIIPVSGRLPPPDVDYLKM